MSEQYILFEHAAGYALFTAEPDEILPRLPEIVSDILKFKQICHFVAFQPFTKRREALENINSISEGILHPSLEDLLKSKLPLENCVLGVEDTQLINQIKESLEINCNSTEAVKELIRGIRFYFHELVPGFKDENAAIKVQLGLAHAYSRCKVKFNISRVDNMIIQTIALLDQLDKDINSLTMRIREWYSHHFPELIKIVPENTLYIQCVDAIRDRKNMPEDAAEKLENILNDPQKVQNIIELSRTSIGMEVAGIDLENMYYFVERVTALTQRRKDLTNYLNSKMGSVAPNLTALIGDFVGARLIAQAGSLTNLAKAPASTVQILGAEKALFRALKTRGNTPKYGIIFNSKFIGRAAKENKGRISRYLANKCSVASRIDCFRDIPTNVFGTLMNKQVDDQLKYYETNEKPKKNVDMMDEAMKEAEKIQREILKRMKKEKRKSQKRKLNELFIPAELDEAMTSVADEPDTSVAKKKKRKLNDFYQESNSSTEPDHSMALSANDSVADIDASMVKKKKSKLKGNEQELNLSTDLDQSMAASANDSVTDVDTSLRKKKKKRELNKQELNQSTDVDQSMATSTNDSVADTSMGKKKKESNLNEQELNFSTDLDQSTSATDEFGTSGGKKKKKKRSKQSDTEH